MRLYQASLETELLEKAKNEELYNRDLENVFRKFEQEADQERAKAEQERILKEDAIKKQKEILQENQAMKKEIEELKKLLNK